MSNEHERAKYHHLEVLVADDDKFILKAIRQILKDMGIDRVATCDDGDEALTLFADMESTNPVPYYDLIICDWMMPGRSGIEILRAVRERRPDLPFIMLTSKKTADAILEAKEADVSAYVAKPLTPAELQRKIRVLMAKAGKVANTLGG